MGPQSPFRGSSWEPLPVDETACSYSWGYLASKTTGVSSLTPASAFHSISSLERPYPPVPRLEEGWAHLFSGLHLPRVLSRPDHQCSWNHESILPGHHPGGHGDQQ